MWKVEKQPGPHTDINNGNSHKKLECSPFCLCWDSKERRL